MKKQGNRIKTNRIQQNDPNDFEKNKSLLKNKDLEDDEDDFANRQYNSFPLRPSVKEFGKGQKKKKKCCGSSTQ